MFDYLRIFLAATEKIERFWVTANGKRQIQNENSAENFSK